MERRPLDRVRVAQVALAALPAGVVVGAAWSRRWMADDGFIYLRVVDNLQHGFGPVFNHGERVEAYTSPAWLALLSALSGVFSSVPREWVAVVLGLVASAGGLAAAMRGALLLWRAAGRRGVALPLGAVVVAGLPPYWDFTTSGLETSLTFAWLGVAFWALTAHMAGSPAARSRVRWTPYRSAVVIGLGPLVRPDLALFSLAFVVALAIVRRAGRREVLRLAVCAAALPFLYEVFRMGYFAELGPNVALAKEAWTPVWSRGWHYLGDFVSPYWLWVPIVTLGALTGVELARARVRAATVVVAAAVCGAVLHGLYVVHAGGDFMHARLLLPTLFGLVLPAAVIVPGQRTRAALAAAIVVSWAVVCAVSLRPSYAGTKQQSQGVGDERSAWRIILGRAHPVTLADGARLAGQRDGLDARRLASHTGERVMELTPPGAGLVDPLVQSGPPRADLPSRVLVTFSTVGRASYAAGPDVHVVDRLGLADSVGARLRVQPGPGPDGRVVTHPRRVGHEKFLPLEWVIARYGDPAHQPPLPPDVGARVEAARRALRCGDLQRVLATTELPMTPGRFLRNVGLAVTLNSFRMPGDPVAAEREICPAPSRGAQPLRNAK